MGLRSALKKVVSKSPVAKIALKHDPLVKDFVKHDPLAKSLGLGVQPGGAPADGVGPATPAAPAMPTRKPSWQEDRIAAIRARFSRTPTPAATAAPAMPAAPAVATPPAASIMPVTNKVVRAAAPNPVADDVAAYSKSWDQGNATY